MFFLVKTLTAMRISTRQFINVSLITLQTYYEEMDL